MAGLSSLAWRSLAARRVRSGLTVVGIALGVGVLFASMAMDAGIDRSIERTVAGLVGRAQLRVSALTDQGLSAASVSAVRNALGVDVAAPEIERRTYLRPDVGAGGGLPPPVTVLGIDPLVDGDIHDLAMADGAAMERRDEALAVISQRLARDDGYELGDELILQGAGDPERFRVVGIAAGDGPLAGAGGRTMIIPIEAAGRIFGLEGATRVDIRLAEGSTIQDVEQELASALTTEPYVLSSPADLAASLRASTADFQSTTALIAAVALFVGAFLIFNTLSMTLAERVREVGLLRAAGATRRQVMGFVLTGAAVLGIAGSVLGVLVGLLLARVMSGYVGSVGAIAVEQVEAPPRAFLIALGVGFGVTVAAALEPAWRASRIAPVDALKLRSEPTGGGPARLRWLLLVFGAIAVAGLLVWPRGGGNAELIRAFAVYALLLAAVLVSPFVLVPLGRLAGVPFGLLLRFEERLARSALVRDRSRTALTVGALTVGLAMIVAIGGVAQNARQAATAWLAGVIPGDEIVTSIRPVGLDERVAETLAAVDGVAHVTPVATFDIALRGIRVDAAAIVGADFLADGRLRFVSGDRTAALTSLDAGGSVVVPGSLADRLGLHLGDRLMFGSGGDAVKELRVAGIAERTLPGRAGETVLVGWPDATATFGVAGADFFGVRFAPGQASVAQPALEAEARSLALEPSTLDRVQGAVSDALGRVFALFDALALVAVVVAALGIFNTLTMNVVERVREIGVLRAAGMTRRQVGRMVVVEAGILGLLGAVLGAVTGLAAGAVMVVLAGGAIELPLDVPWSAIGLCLLLGVGVSMLAAWYPARLAGRLSIVRAVQFE